VKRWLRLRVTTSEHLKTADGMRTAGTLRPALPPASPSTPCARSHFAHIVCRKYPNDGAVGKRVQVVIAYTGVL